MSTKKKSRGARPPGFKRIVFQVPIEEDLWFSELVETTGLTRIGLFRLLLDAYAAQIGHRPRPKKF